MSELNPGSFEYDKTVKHSATTFRDKLMKRNMSQDSNVNVWSSVPYRDMIYFFLSHQVSTHFVAHQTPIPGSCNLTLSTNTTVVLLFASDHRH
jgi:hypothetical protein